MRLRSITARDSDRMKTRPSLESDLSLLGELSQIKLIFQRTPLCLLSKEEKKKTITIKSSILDLISMEACFWHGIKSIFYFFLSRNSVHFSQFQLFLCNSEFTSRNSIFLLAILSFYSQFYLFTRNSEFTSRNSDFTSRNSIFLLAILSLHLAILYFYSQF